MTSNIGERLQAIQKYVEDDKMFLANYSDGLTDLHLPKLIEFAEAQNKIGSFLSVRPSLSYHVISADSDWLVQEIREMSHAQMRVNGGFFVFRQDIFDYIRAGEELVREPFQRLIREKQLAVFPYDDFFAAMDTFKDKQNLDDLYASGTAPWQVWKTRVNGNGTTPEVSVRLEEKNCGKTRGNLTCRRSSGRFRTAKSPGFSVWVPIAMTSKLDAAEPSCACS